MFFRWDWLRPALTAPIVPTLGPVYPDALTVDIFEDTLGVAVTGDFLPYDKDQRWGGEKAEAVLCSDVVHQSDHTLIPALTRRGRGTVKAFAYGHHSSIMAEAAELATKFATVHDAVNAQIVRPLGPETGPLPVRPYPTEKLCCRPLPGPGGLVRPVTDWPTSVQEPFARSPKPWRAIA
ncbi:hypothetical protein [Streptomyces sp. NPDC058664]|uniref:hypothetical protein n=1 Tax=unclassified Streptomyces TaxID=2593676 RepID=UPI00365588FC